MDGSFRLWGCMIDEPDFFSLWATLDVRSTLSGCLPVSTSFVRTLQMWEFQDRMGTKDTFATIFSDGSVHETVVTVSPPRLVSIFGRRHNQWMKSQNFDCRPPTCLSQSSRLLHSRLFAGSQLPNLRYTLIIPTKIGSSQFALIGRCSRGTLLRAQLNFEGASDTGSTAFRIPTSSVGSIQSIAASENSDSLLVRGENGRLQNWTMKDERFVESFISESELSDADGITSWDQGSFQSLPVA